MNWKYFHFLSLVILLLFLGSFSQGQTNDRVQTESNNVIMNNEKSPEFWVSVVSVLVSIVTVLVALAAIIPAVAIIIQIRRSKKEIKDLTNRYDNNLTEKENRLREFVAQSINKFKPPEEILKSANEKTEVICKELSNNINAFEEDIDRKFKQHERNLENAISRLDELKTDLNKMELDIKSKPNKNDILVEVEKRYKIPQDLMEIILGRVVMAFGCLQKLSEDERKEIRKVLSANPILMNDDKK